jgi:hypothetical protein
MKGPRVLRTLSFDRKVHDRLTRKLNVMPVLVDPRGAQPFIAADG